MLIKGTLHSHLADINEQAEKLFFQIVNDMAKAKGITEQLKAEDQMLWVQKMNNLRERSKEVVLEELIYA